MARYIFY